MCIVCVEIMNERLTLLEAQRALTELIATSEDDSKDEHYLEIYDAVVKDLMEIDSI